jgi:hypothetical protein
MGADAPMLSAKLLAWNGGRRHCTYCDVPMVVSKHPADHHNPRRMTVDHIVPRAWHQPVAPGIVNKRWACQSCNAGRATCGHCVGALACARTVADETCVPLPQVLAEWGMGSIAQAMWRPNA